MKTCLPMLSTPLGMMTSTYFFVWGGREKKSLQKKFSDQTQTTYQGGFYTYRQAKLLKSRFDKRCVLCENLLQVSASAHVSQNCRDR